MPRILLIGSVVLTAVVTLAPSIPLGVPGEWTWSRHAGISSFVDVVDRLVPALLCGAAFVLFAEWGRRRILQVGGRGKAGLYTLLILVAASWILSVQKSTPVAYRDIKPLWVLYDRSSSGYFIEAATRINSADEFLQAYEARMEQGDVLHVGTHPPGLFLLAFGCLEICRSSESICSLVEACHSRHEREAFRLVETETRYATALDRSELAGLQLLSLVTSIAVVLAIVPLALLCRHLFDHVTAWKCCCLWPLLPSLTIFLPKSDLLFPLTSMSALTLMVLAMQHRKTLLLAVPAGLVLWVGLLLSLAHLPVIFLLAVFSLLRFVKFGWSTLKRDACVLGIMIFTVAATAILFSVVYDCNLLNVWLWNLTNHESFYSEYQRSWWKWLLVNPVELAFAVGLPVAFMAFAGLKSSLHQLRPNRQSGTKKDKATAGLLVAAAAATILVLLMSGKNQGEAARLWCFLTPWLLLSCGHFFTQHATPENRSLFPALVATQLICALLTVSHVAGFSFGTETPSTQSTATE